MFKVTRFLQTSNLSSLSRDMMTDWIVFRNCFWSSSLLPSPWVSPSDPVVCVTVLTHEPLDAIILDGLRMRKRFDRASCWRKTRQSRLLRHATPLSLICTKTKHNRDIINRPNTQRNEVAMCNNGNKLQWR